MTDDGYCTVSHEEAHAVSVGLLRYLESLEVNEETALAGLAMSVGRIVSPKILSAPEEADFLKSLYEWASLYFMPGTLQ